MQKQVFIDREFGAADPARFNRFLAAVDQAAVAAPNGEVGDLDALIASFEAKYCFDSGVLRAQLDAGRIVEDESICAWLLLLRRRQHLVDRKARARAL